MGLLDWFRSKQPARPSKAKEVSLTSDESELSRAIESVAILIDDQPAFKSKPGKSRHNLVRSLLRGLGSNSIGQTTRRRDSPLKSWG